MAVPKARIEVYRNRVGQWEFRAKSGNGRIVGASEEGVKQFTYAVKRARRQFPDLPVFQEKDGALIPVEVAS